MSVRALSWAWEQACGNAQQKLVLLALADRADEDGYCWPSRKWLEIKTGMHVESVKRALSALNKAGFFSRSQVSNGDGTFSTNRYELALDRGSTVTRGTVGRPWVTSDPQDSQVFRVEPDGSTRSSDRGSPATRGADVVWDALAEVFGSSPVSGTNAHGKRNKAVADLKKLGGTPTSIRRAAQLWPKSYPDARLTDVALATHFLDLIAGDPAARHPHADPIDVALRWAAGAGRQIRNEDRLAVLPGRDRLTDEQIAQVLTACEAA